MWAVQDVARDAVRRQGVGLDREQVADKVAEAARRERETREQLRAPVAVSGLQGLGRIRSGSPRYGRPGMGSGGAWPR
ncbi:hypothetical protein SGRIM119S_07119 [Streptomyces griseorubiginosus]